MRILAIPLFLLSVLTGWCADVNITNVPLSAKMIYSDYLLGLTGTVNLANSHSRLLKVSDLPSLITNVYGSSNFWGFLSPTNIPGNINATGATNFWGVLSNTNLPATLTKNTTGNAAGASNFWGVLNATNFPATLNLDTIEANTAYVSNHLSVLSGAANMFDVNGGVIETFCPMSASNIVCKEGSYFTGNAAGLSNMPGTGVLLTYPITGGIAFITNGNYIIISNTVTGGSATNAIATTNGFGTNVTLYGVNVMPGTLQVSNLIATNMSVDTINAGTLVLSNGLGATNITGTLSNNTTGQAGSIPMGLESTTVKYFPVFTDSTGTNYVEGGAFTYSNSVLTMNGPVVSIAASASNSPAQNEFPTAHWVRSLFNNGVLDYSATNVDLTATNSDGYIVYKFLGAIPLTTTRTYSAVTNGEYMGGSVTTNAFQFLQGPIDVHAFLQKSASGTALVHPEIYYSYDKTNWYGDWSAGDQSITTGTNLYGWVISFPAITSTNDTGFYVQRRYKVTSQTSTPDITLHIGTNFVSGPNDASHIAFSGPNSGTGNAYLANNQTFMGNNGFLGTVSLGGETQVTNNFTYMMRTTNDFAAGASNVIVNMDISTLNLDPLTNNICLTNFTGLVVGTSKNKLIRINPSATFTITYPPDGSVPGGGLFWRTNCPPQANRPYTSVTNGSIYILSITSMGTNVMASMTEWK